MILHPAILTLFPYTTLFRSGHASTRLIRRELPQLLGPNKHSLNVPNAYTLEYLQQAPEISLNLPQSFGPFKTVEDRKSTRLNSSHVAISYAVFCLKKKNTKH